MSRYLVIDGGTTNLRVTLTDETAKILGRQKRNIGAAATAAAGSSSALHEAVRECIDTLLADNSLKADEIDGCVAYGMITCASGLREVPHLCAPAGMADFRAGMEEELFADIAPFPIRFIPGLRNFAGEVTLDNLKCMDMMRGEETESVGFHALMQPDHACVLMLPGSHNKLIAMDREGRQLGCMTTISGELLAVLTHHTILTEAVGGQFLQPEEYDRELLLAGARACADGLGRAAFSTRILRTLGAMPREKVASFLLGVVLHSDVEALRSFGAVQKGAKLYIAGKEPLQQALTDLLESSGYSVEAVPSQVVQKIGLVGALMIAGWYVQPVMPASPSGMKKE